jgi:hypothetical protein
MTETRQNPAADPQDTIRLRGEHVANLRQYLEGVRLKWGADRGYSDEFAAAHDAVLRRIVEEPDALVTVVTGMDDICNCGVCPRVRAHCSSAELEETDRRVAGEYGVQTGRQYRSADLLETLRAAGEADA